MTSKKPPPDDPKQSKRFVETAKALDVEARAKDFRKAFNAIIPKRKSRKETKSK
jgi:hypothetical protein